MRQSRMVLLFWLLIVSVESFVPANGKVQTLSAVVAVETKFEAKHAYSSFPWDKPTSMLSSRPKAIRIDLRKPTSEC